LSDTSPISTDYTLDFQSPDFENDSKILIDFLLINAQVLFPEQQDERNNMFRLVKTKHVAGWSFSKLHLDKHLVRKMYEANTGEFKHITSAWSDMWSSAMGKQYIGEPFVEQLARWLTTKMQKKGSKAQIKIGKEMADLTQGLSGGTGPGLV
jgi:hypothetical protein